jgi:hypothetical protein
VANGIGNGNGNGHASIEKWVGRWLVGGGSLMAVAVGFWITVSKDAQIAIDIAAQHGKELQMVNARILHLEQELRDRTQLRYTSADAEKDLGYLRRDLNQCLSEIEKHKREH